MLSEKHIGTDRLALIRDPDRRLSPAETARYETLIGGRAARQPVSRLLGRREFWGLDFAVTSDTLVPRPESETLIEAALFQWVTPGWTDLPWLLIVGLCALTAHYSLANAFLHADATIVMPMEFMRLPLIALVAYILYNEPLEFFVFLGAALIFAGNYYSIRRESRL